MSTAKIFDSKNIRHDNFLLGRTSEFQMEVELLKHLENKYEMPMSEAVKLPRPEAVKLPMSEAVKFGADKPETRNDETKTDSRAPDSSSRPDSDPRPGSDAAPSKKEPDSGSRPDTGAKSHSKTPDTVSDIAGKTNSESKPEPGSKPDASQVQSRLG